MNYLKRAEELYQETVENRRHLHKYPELGFELAETVKFVKGKLKDYGYDPKDIEPSGLTATVGSGEPVILLRADMDALPIKEDTDLEFASTNDYMHACGHDIHTAILLTVAKILKENESNLKGTVKFLFQPAEELLIGAKKMIEAGILENPKVDVAIAAHVSPPYEKGIHLVEGVGLSAGNNFAIKIHGKSTHGARPEDGIDPVYIAAQIINAMQGLTTRELPFDSSATLTVGRLIANGAANVIPGEVEMAGTVRTFEKKSQDQLKKRLPEIVKGIAELYGATAEFEFTSDVPPVYNDPELAREFKQHLEETLGNDILIKNVQRTAASDDFAFISEKVPSIYFRIGVLNPDRGVRPVHHPKFEVDEEVMVGGIATFCELATYWLAQNAK